MTDKELLELAAKAAGIVVIRSRLNDPACLDFVIENSPRNPDERLGPWNPLTDDGDALRLAVKLNLKIECMVGQSAARTFDNKCAGCVDHADNEQYPGIEFAADPYAATRLAIVRAAAEIGKTC